MSPQKIENIKKILPSKKFTKIIALCALGVLVFIVITSFFGSRTNFFGAKASIPVREGDTLGDIMARDSNQNGITDWEESLWGLEPTADGPTNKKIVDEKKIAAGIELTAEGDPIEPMTPTDKFAREFLASILALRQAGNLTPEAVGNIANSIGQNLDSKRPVLVTYTAKDQKIVTTPATQARATYTLQLEKIVNQYDKLGIGTELSILGENVGSDDEESLKKLEPIASAYTEFSKKIIATPVPKDAAEDILSLANASARIGIALMQVSKIHTDILSGMVGIDEYIKASDIFDTATNNLADYFAS